MKLWLMKTQEKLSHDEYYGFVVRAYSQHQARSIAEKAYSQTGQEPNFSCEELTPEGKPEIVLSSFNAG